MKRILVIAIFLLFSPWTEAQDLPDLYVIIDGKPATAEAFQRIQSDSATVIYFLPPEKAVALYGPVAAKGALIITSRKKPVENPVFLKNGERIHPDSIDYKNVTRIDVIRGAKAVDLYGLAGKDGVYILHEEEAQPTDVILRWTNEKGNPVKRGKVISENGSILARTDKCGWAVLENFSLGKSVTLSTANKSTRIKITQKVMNVKL